MLSSVDKCFEVAFRSFDGAVAGVQNVKARRRDVQGYTIDRSGTHCRIAHDPFASRGFLTSDLELRLHERYEFAMNGEAAGDRRKQLSEADERCVDHDEIRKAADVIGLERSRVCAFEDHNAGIDPQLVRELAIPDVDRNNTRCAALKKTICEAAGGCAQIDTPFLGYGDVERGESTVQLHATTRNERMILAAYR